MTNLVHRDIEALLSDSSPEVRESLSELLPSMYNELRGLARRVLARERRNHTLQPTALVHEAYMRLAAQRGEGFISRAHFLGLAAQMIRRILVDDLAGVAGLERVLVSRDGRYYAYSYWTTTKSDSCVIDGLQDRLW